MSHGASCHNGFLKKNYLLERSIGHILDVSVNANSFLGQCSVIASAALTKDRVLNYFPRKNSTLRYACDETFSDECEFAARAEGE